jgi:hypothetical protein
MNRILSRFGIGIQVSLIGGAALAGFIAIAGIYFYSAITTGSAREESAQATERRSEMNRIAINLLEMRRDEKNFFLRRDETYVAAQRKKSESARIELRQLAGRDRGPAQ